MQKVIHLGVEDMGSSWGTHKGQRCVFIGPCDGDSGTVLVLHGISAGELLINDIQCALYEDLPVSS